MLLPDLAQLMLCNPEDGDVPTLDYPRAKNCLQAAFMWELERLDCIRVGDMNVTRGEAARPCPLGAEFDSWLASLERPEPQTHNWFRLRMEPSEGLFTEFFAQRLVRAGLAEKTTVSHLLFFKKAAYPLNAQGKARREDLRTRVSEVVHALQAGPLTLGAFQPQEWMLGFFLDAMRVLPRAIGLKKQERCLISSQALQTLLSNRCLSPGLARATYEFSRDAGDLNSLLNFTFDALDFATNFGESYQSAPGSWGSDNAALGEGKKLVQPDQG
ncbi:MAG: GPP34 family phosphoprotein [Vulcanimicrobiota bacterium]